MLLSAWEISLLSLKGLSPLEFISCEVPFIFLSESIHSLKLLLKHLNLTITYGFCDIQRYILPLENFAMILKNFLICLF